MLPRMMSVISPPMNMKKIAEAGLNFISVSIKPFIPEEPLIVVVAFSTGRSSLIKKCGRCKIRAVYPSHLFFQIAVFRTLCAR